MKLSTRTLLPILLSFAIALTVSSAFAQSKKKSKSRASSTYLKYELRKGLDSEEKIPGNKDVYVCNNGSSEAKVTINISQRLNGRPYGKDISRSVTVPKGDCVYLGMSKFREPGSILNWGDIQYSIK